MEAAAGSSSSGGGPGGGGGGRVAITTSPAAAAEKKLNSFVRAVVLFERLGDALGTLAFTWATVVLLGGYPTVLTDDDFALVTVIILLEALRVFSRDNWMDYRIVFRSRGSVRPLGWSGLIVVACICNVLELLAYLYGFAYGSGWAVWIQKLIDAVVASTLLLTSIIGKLLSPGVLKHVPGQVRRFISLGSPLAAVLLLVPSLLKAASTMQSHMAINWSMFTLLLVAVLLLTLSRLVDAALGNKYVFWRRIILNICLFAELLMLVFLHDSLRKRIFMAIFQAYAFLCVSFGNLLLPTAMVRVMIALRRLIPHDYYNGGGSEEEQHESRINFALSLDIFFVMLLGQGMLYLLSCTLDVLSFLPRRHLARQGGFRGYQGVQSINLYYEYAMEKSMERDVVVRKQINLDSFSIHSICSDSPKLQLNGIWTMHILLRQEPSRTQLLSKLHRDANAIARLINMLEWRRPEDAAIRLFAAKVTAVLAGTFRLVSIPGAMQAFSALLDADSDGTETESLQDSLPGLGLSIFDSLASNSSYDFHNSCLEIIRAAEDLIPKIIQFICYRHDGNDMQEQNTNEAAVAQKKIFLMESALQLLGRLSSISGKIGVALRHELQEHPTLLANLSAISDDRFSSQKARNLALVILSILTM